MHNDILTDTQCTLLSLVKAFTQDFYLVGGTAIALYIGHRRSIDFDLFTRKTFTSYKIERQLDDLGFGYQLRYEDADQLHITVEGIKITFFHYPFEIPLVHTFEQSIRMPDLVSLAAMKAYAFGRKAKWKDYVDMYYILKDFHTLQEVVARAATIYKQAFSEKLFRQQLCFFDDIDYSEEVEYIGEPKSSQEIRTFLTDMAVTLF